MIEPTWTSGDVTLYLGDCLEVLPTLAPGSVDAVVTDPPYGVDKAAWDGDIWDLLTRAANESARALKDSGICFWFTATRHLPRTIEATAAIPYRWQFIWYASNNMAHGDIGFQNYTAALVLAPGKAWRNMQDLRNVPIQNGKAEKLGHPTPKPLDLMLYLVEKATMPGATVLDPFMGSGTTGVACVQTGRRFIGIEIDPGYFEIAVKRIEAAQLQERMPI